MTGYGAAAGSNRFSREEKDKIILEFMPRIKSWVLRISTTLPDTVDVDDLYSSACLGLIESLERFDKDRNVNFYTFGERRIKGAILDTLRNLDYLPRNVRTRLKQLERHIGNHYRTAGEKPTVEEIIENSDFSEQEVYRLLELMENDKILSLDESVGPEGDTSLVDFIKSTGLTPEDEALKTRLVDTLGEEIENLSEKEKYVVSLYYYEELTMKEIAMVLGITESRVSQIHSAATAKLKKKLKEFY
ncbi:RNA polymerase, sigma 28 subunit, FliA/WhiG [Denitrovibrio acetiphilus DSM 12809]|uniref:RNA polymerase, sigma 28 subunit, FliA/WhiG n=1 Tax=Denitrovibrio acetiphilus (strain DSM 12809 / NBRC 114555 / N2460) TaxID=522772 RepID=D4H6C4_DENA2|nr:FliA/WhiG family RNA polymerase sigma factor [Denitrovibrio acetiphilus]ADD69598.1 RNA polymerase, sigma 28 subunit, FliA/WhiG [Denitrovibrio acetiphilus DSM 12809]